MNEWVDGKWDRDDINEASGMEEEKGGQKGDWEILIKPQEDLIKDTTREYNLVEIILRNVSNKISWCKNMSIAIV